jgi:hypothetical protein
VKSNPGYTQTPAMTHMPSHMEDEMPCVMFAHAYVPDQPYVGFFPLHEALMKGTIFPNLYGVYPVPKSENE